MKIGNDGKGSREWSIPEVGAVRQIKFYSASGVWLTVDQGWIVNCPTNDRARGDDVKEIETSKPVKAIKENWKREDNYFMKHKSGFRHDNYGVTLYIHLRPVLPQEVKVTETDVQADYAQCWNIPIRAILKDGTPVVFMRHIGPNTRTAKTIFGQMVEDLGNALQLDGLDVENYLLTRLLRKWDIERKVAVSNVVIDSESGRTFREFTDAEICRMQDERVVFREADTDATVNRFNVSENWRRNQGVDWHAALIKVANGEEQG